MTAPDRTADRRLTAAVRRGLARYQSLLALVGLLLGSSPYLIAVYSALADTLADPERAAAFTSADSSHYLEMAEAFRSGQFLDKYVTVRPHRQPLYPALLAAAMALGADDLMELATVNVIVGLVTIICLYGAGRWLFGSWWVGLAGALAYASSDFILRNISSRILTEPVFAFAALLVVLFALQYMQRNRAAYLCLAAAAAGLAYLTRPNGLFLMAAMWATLLAHDLLQRYLTVSSGAGGAKAAFRSRALDGRNLIGRFGAAALIFAIVATPSWVPRALHYGDPAYHGYLSNYLWVDTYQEGHVSEPKYGPRDYFRTHDFRDVVIRVGAGLEHVYWTVPIKLGWVLYYLALIGMVGALVSLRPSYLFLILFMLIQSMPLIWTAISNPNLRVHYGGIFPFLLVFVMILVDRCSLALRRSPSLFRDWLQTAPRPWSAGEWTEQPPRQD